MSAHGSYPWAAGYYDDGDRPQIVTSRFKYEDSHTIDRYHATGGYEGLKKALSMPPEEVHDEVRKSTLLGRGGAGVPPRGQW
ncbi:MAG: NADH-quinone oxidoreductase subunit F, partial [Ilumatobacter fluminis]